MGIFSRKSKPQIIETSSSLPSTNPHRNWKPNATRQALYAAMMRDGFFSTNVDRLLYGWETTGNSIDYYLMNELRSLRARSRSLIRSNPYGKRFIATVKSNVVGPSGVKLQAKSLMRDGTLDTDANNAIEKAFEVWGYQYADYQGKKTFLDLQQLAISTAAQDGEFIFRKWYTGRYGFQLQIMDPELLNVEKNETNGDNEIRLGVEYDPEGRIVQYHFKRKSHPVSGGYDNYDKFTVPAEAIIHGYIDEWPDQSRGIPWMHASLEKSKHLEKYEEAAIVKARSTAATMAVLRSEEGDAYEGEEEGYDGVTIDEFEAGTIKDIGNRQLTHVDSAYPHQMYSSFVKNHLQGIASGLGISYHALSNDLEGVNYSSIRAGVLEDREIFKGLQDWFIRSFVRPVFEEWVTIAVMRRLITIRGVPLNKPVSEYYPAHYQPRRWAWVDPQKDGTANSLAIANNLKSRSQVIREQGDDPETIFREIQAEKAMMEELGIAPEEVINGQEPVE